MTDIVTTYALSPWQRYLLLESLRRPRDGILVHQHHLRLSGPLKTDVLFRAWQLIAQRYEVFRSRFDWRSQSEPLQEVLNDAKLPWRELCLANLPLTERNHLVDRLRTQERQQYFNFAAPPLGRLCLIRYDANHHQLVWTYHCLLLDGWSAKILLMELETLYSDLLQHATSELAKPQPFSNYVAWLQGADGEAAKAFWHNHLQAAPSPAPPPFENLRCGPGLDLHQRTRVLPDILQQSLAIMAQTYRLRFETLLHGAWALLLCQHSGERRAVFGSSVASRDIPLPGIETMVGPLTNLLPLSIDVDPSMPLALWLQRIENVLAERAKHAHLSMTDVAEAAGKPPHMPLFHTALLPQSFPIRSSKTEDSLHVTTLADVLTYPMPLCLAADVDDQISLQLQYNRVRIDRSGAERLLDQLVSLLLQFSAAPEYPLEDLRIIGKEEQNTLVQWQSHEADRDVGESLPVALLQATTDKPDQVSLVEGPCQVTRAFFFKRAQMVAEVLHETGIGPGFRVGLWSERLLDSMAGMFGIWLTGATWVDVTRGAAAHKSCDGLLATDFEKAPHHPIKLAFPKEPGSSSFDRWFHGTDLHAAVFHEEGIMACLNHRQLGHQLTRLQRVLRHPSSRVAESYEDTPAAMLLHAMAIITGTLVRIAPLWEKQWQRVGTAIIALDLDLILADTAALILLKPDQLARPARRPRRVWGQVRPESAQLLERWCRVAGLSIRGMVHAHHAVPFALIGQENQAAPLVGTGVAGQDGTILDATAHFQPIGAAGHWFIPEPLPAFLGPAGLTAAAFRPQPQFNDGPHGKRLLDANLTARYTAAGSIHLVTPAQPSAHESLLLTEIMRALPNIYWAEIEQDHDGLAPIAYVATTANFSTKDLFDILQQPGLPCPRAIVTMAPGSFKPGVAHRASRICFFRSPSEAVAAAFWRETTPLPNPTLGFFSAGGSVRHLPWLVHRLNRFFGSSLALGDVIDDLSLRGLSHRFNRCQPWQALPTHLERELATGSQTRLWSQQQLNGGDIGEHLASGFRLEGRMSLPALDRAAAILSQRHANLRLQLHPYGAELYQRIDANTGCQPILVDARGLPGETRRTVIAELTDKLFHHPFDLEQGDLLRLVVIRVGTFRHQCWLFAHPVILDETSLTYLTHALADYYAWYARGPRQMDRAVTHDPFPQPRQLPLQLAGELRDRAHSARAQARVKALGNNHFCLPLPIEAPDHACAEACEVFTLDAIHSESIDHLAQASQSTPLSVLFAVFGLLCSRYCRQNNLIIAMPTANRDLTPDERYIGRLSNLVPVQMSWHAEATGREALQAIDGNLSVALQDRDIAWEDLHAQLALETDPQNLLGITSRFAWDTPITFQHDLPDWPGLDITPLPNPTRAARPGLTLRVNEAPHGAHLSWHFPDLPQNRRMVQYMQQHFLVLLDNLTSMPDTAFNGLAMLTADELTAQLAHWNQSGRTLTVSWTSCFFQQVSERGDSVALRVTNRLEDTPCHLSYEQLHDKANLLAQTLAQSGIGSEHRVLLYLTRGRASLVAKLAIRFLGAAACPVEPSNSPEHMIRLLKDWQPEIVLTDPLHRSQIELLLDRHDHISIWSLNNQSELVHPDKNRSTHQKTMCTWQEPLPMAQALVACQMDTLKPRIVPISYGAIDAAINDHLMRLQIQMGDNVDHALPRHSVSGNIHWLTTLRAGATICVQQDLTMTGEALVTNLRRQCVAHLFLPAHALDNLPYTPLPWLRTVTVTDAPASGSLVGRWGVDRDFFSLYGHIETLDMGLHHINDPFNQDQRLGEPAQVAVTYLVDELGRPVPPKVPGEILMGGDLLARCYEGNPKTTAARFIPDPFQTTRLSLTPTNDQDQRKDIPTDGGARVFRTGQMAYRDLNGILHWLGHKERIQFGTGRWWQPPPLTTTICAPFDLTLDREQPSGIQLWGAADGPQFSLRQFAVALATSATQLTSPVFLLSQRVAGARLNLPLPSPQTATAQVVFSILEALLGRSIGWDAAVTPLLKSPTQGLVASRLLQRALVRDISSTFFFDNPTPRIAATALAKYLATDSQADPAPARSADGFPCDQYIWDLVKNRNWGQASSAISLTGAVDIPMLADAIAASACQLTPLQQRVAYLNNTPSLDKTNAPEAVVIDLQNIPQQALGQTWHHVLQLAACQRLSAQDALQRITIIRSAPDHHDLIFTCHPLNGAHHMADLWRQQSLWLYRFWQDTATRALAYPTWLPPQSMAYTPADEPVPSPTHLHENEHKSAEFCHVHQQSLPKTTLTALKYLGTCFGLPPEVCLLSGLLIWLARARHTEQPSLVLASNRSDRAWDQSRGPLAPWHFMHTRLNFHTQIQSVLENVQTRWIRAQVCEPLDWQRILSLLGDSLPPIMWRTRLPQPTEATHLLTTTQLYLARQACSASLTIEWLPDNECPLQWHYDPQAFDQGVIQAWSESWLHLVEAMAQDLTQPVGTLSMLSSQQQKRMLTSWNDTQQTFPGPPLLQQYMARRAMRTPDAPALIFETTKSTNATWGHTCTITYRTLNMRANRLARSLRTLGVTNDVPVVLFLQSPPAIMVGILGCWKAGGAIVPLPPSFPDAKRNAIMAASGAALVVAEAGGRRPPTTDRDRCLIISGMGKFMGPRFEERMELELSPSDQHPDHLACLIFTADPAGGTRAAALTHRAVGNRVLGTQAAAPLGLGDRFLQHAPFGQPVSFWEYMGALINGAATVTAPPTITDQPRTFLTFLKRLLITHVYLLPSQLSRLLETWQKLPHIERPKPRCLFTGGEAFPAALQRRCREITGAQIRHFFGSAETAATATLWQPKPGDIDRDAGLGRPMPNTAVYVLDHHLNPVPIAIPGDVYLGGLSLARGYWQQPAATAAHFLPHPLAKQPGQRLFRTGDRGLWTPDGNLVHLGRSDHRCFRLGWRIECSEVAANLGEHQAIAEACVRFMPSPSHGTGRLIAYYVSSVDDLDPDDLQQFLTSRLPAFMLPSLWTRMARLPRDARGYIDEAGLPKPDASDH